MSARRSRRALPWNAATADRLIAGTVAALSAAYNRLPRSKPPLDVPAINAAEDALDVAYRAQDLRAVEAACAYFALVCRRQFAVWHPTTTPHQGRLAA
jgi:hypothetical protein